MKKKISKKVFNKNNFKIIYFSLFSFVFTLFGVIYSMIDPTNGIWSTHKMNGKLLINGKIPQPPAYPMWGYSILAGFLGNAILILEVILTLSLSIYWYNSINKGFQGKLSR